MVPIGNEIFGFVTDEIGETMGDYGLQECEIPRQKSAFFSELIHDKTGSVAPNLCKLSITFFRKIRFKGSAIV